MDGRPSAMNGREFAELIERSEMAVSKYRAAGHLVTDAEDKILPLESLRALEGHMEEANRRLGLQRLLGDEAFALLAANDQPLPRSAKAELDEIKRDNAKIDLALKAGELVEVAEVEKRNHQAVAAMREAMEVALAETVETLSAELSLPPDRAAMVKKHLKRMNAKSFTVFSAAMTALADEDDAEHEQPPPVAGASLL